MSINIKWNSQRQDDTGFCYVSDLFRLSGSIDRQSGRFLWIAEMGWKHESPDETRGHSDTRSEAVKAAKSAAVEMLMEEIEAVPQPLTVVVPPIEWVSQTAEGPWYSTNLKHRIVKTDGGFEWQRKFPKAGIEKWERIFQEEAFDRIEATINEYQQVEVNQALEGCNVQPWRDPQGLVDALKKIEAMIVYSFNAVKNTREIDTTKIESLCRLTLKQWEEGK